MRSSEETCPSILQQHTTSRSENTSSPTQGNSTVVTDRDVFCRATRTCPSRREDNMDANTTRAMRRQTEKSMNETVLYGFSY